MKKQDVLNRISNSESSIFSKEDVIRLIVSIEMETSICESQFEDALSLVLENLERDSRNNGLIDYKTADFGLDGNEITLENVDVEIDSIMGMVRDVFTEKFDIVELGI